MQIKAAKHLRVALVSVWHTTPKRWPCFISTVKRKRVLMRKQAPWSKRKLNIIPATIQQKFVCLCVQWRTRRGVGEVCRPPGLKISGQTLFSEQAQIAKKSWKIKRIWMQWNFSGQTLFFRAHSVLQGKRKLLKNTECSLQSMFNTMKIFRANSVFSESASCSKILKDIKYLITVKNSRANSVFQGKRKLFKILKHKK